MLNLYTYLKNEYNYTEYETKLIRYTIITVLSEVSKFTLIGLFFYLFCNLFYYLWSAIILIILRRYSGGYHCRTYLSCFIFSFVYMYLCIILLPLVHIEKFIQLLLLVLTFLVVYKIAPIPSVYHAKLNKKQIHRYRICIFTIIIIYFLLVLLLPNSRFLSVDFWTIIIHTLQLLIEFLKRRYTHEVTKN